MRTILSHRPLLILALIVAVAAAARSVAIYMSPYIWGVDTWSYILNAEALLGEPLPAFAAIRPPLAPGYSLIPLMWLFGNAAGVAIWSLIVSLPVIPAAYYLGRGFLTPRQALCAAALVAASYNLTEAFINGAVILQALAVLLVSLRILLDWSQGEPMTWQRCAVIGVATALLPWLNQTFSAIYIMAFAVCLPVAAFERRRALGIGWSGMARAQDTRWLAWALAIGGALAACALPWYLTVTPDAPLTQNPYASIGTIQFLMTSKHEDEVRFMVTSIQFPHIAIAALIGFLGWIAGAPRVLVAMICLAGVSMAFHSPNEAVGNPPWRMRYVMDATALVTLPHIWHRYIGYWNPSLLSVAVWISGMGVLVASSLYLAANNSNSFMYVSNRDIVAAIRIARDDMGLTSGVTYYSYVSKFTHAFSDEEVRPGIISEGIGGRVIYNDGLRYNDYLRDPTPAELDGYCLLGRGFQHILERYSYAYICDPIAVADRWGVDYVLTTDALDGFRGWPAYIAGLRDAEWLTLVYERDGVGIWAIAPPR